ncbi:MAG: YggT family protein, partial [Eubacterium sp.]
QAVLSWFVRDMHSGLARFYMLLSRFTEPFVAPCRKLLYRLNINTGIFDFSLLVAFLFIEIIEKVLIRLLGVILL